MNIKTLRPEILVSYALAVFAYAFAIYVGATVGGEMGPRLMLLFAVASVSAVAAATFHWGRLSGFPVVSEERGFSLEFFLRNLVMTVLVVVMLTILASPVWGLVFWLISKK